MITISKYFELKPIFRDILNLDENSGVASETEEHFNVPWRIVISRSNGYLSFFIHCMKPEETDEKWSIEADIILRITSGKTKFMDGKNTFGKIERKKTSASYGSADFTSWETMKKNYLVNNSLMVEVRVEIRKMTGFYNRDIIDFTDTSEEMTKFKVKIDKRSFHVSKEFLAVHSKCFKKCLTGKYKNKSKLPLDGADAVDFQKLLEVLQGEDVIDENNVEGIVLLSTIFEVPVGSARCEEFLINKSEKSLNKKLQMADRYKLMNLKDYCLNPAEDSSDTSLENTTVVYRDFSTTDNNTSNRDVSFQNDDNSVVLKLENETVETTEVENVPVLAIPSELPDLETVADGEIEEKQASPQLVRKSSTTYLTCEMFNYKSLSTDVLDASKVLDSSIENGLECIWSGHLLSPRGPVDFIWKFDWEKLKILGVVGFTGEILISPVVESSGAFQSVRIDVDLSEQNDMIERVIAMQSEYTSIGARFEYSLIPLLNEPPSNLESNAPSTSESAPRDEVISSSNKNDIVLIVDKRTVCVNKAFLSYHSDFFEALFSSGDEKEKYSINDVAYEDFDLIMKVLHAEPIPDENLQKLLELADRFKMKSVKFRVENHLLNNSKIDNHKMMWMADKYGMTRLLEKMISFMDTTEKSKEFMKFPEYAELSRETKAKLFQRLKFE